MQEAFCVATEKIEALMASEFPLRWMKATIKNVARNMKRHESYQKALFLYLEDLKAAPTAPDSLGGIDILELCEQLVGKDNFELFKRVVLDGTSYVDMANELGINMWACRKRVQRTSEILQKNLKEYFQ